MTTYHTPNEVNKIVDGQSRAGEAGANLADVLEAARKVVELNAIVKRHRERYLDRVNCGRIIQYNDDLDRQAWLALQGLEKSLDELKAALEASNGRRNYA